MLFMTTTFFFTLFLAMTSVVNALPTALGKRDVYVPPVLYPTADTVWKVGVKHSVSWDNSNPPQNITNPTGKIQLRKGDRTLPQVLASGFPIVSGKTQITVPNVEPGDDYRIVLFGDSGNFSPEFKIVD